MRRERLRVLGMAAVLAGMMGVGGRAMGAVVIAGLDGLEGQGFAGRMRISGYSLASPLASAHNGLTSDGNNLWVLDKPFIGSTSQVAMYPMTGGGQPLSKVTVNLSLDDVAYTNGKLYGVVARQDALQIVEIHADGTTNTVLTRTGSTYSGTWRLSGATAGSQLLAFREAGFGPPVSTPLAVLVNATAGSATALSIPAAADSTIKQGAVQDTVIDVGGASFTAIGNSTPLQIVTSQGRLRLSDGAVLAGVTQPNIYGSALNGGSPSMQAFSDEFTYAYAPTKNAQAQTQATTTSTTWGKLYRTPFVWTGNATAQLVNGIAPDGTTLTNVVSSQPFNMNGPAALQANVTAAAPGNFGARALGTGTFSLDLNSAPRGVYGVDSRAQMQATYTYGPTVDPARKVDNGSYGTLAFAYDPISSNLVGNGDFELSYYGWDDVSTPGFTFSPFVISDGGTGSHVPWMTASVGSPVILRQILELPTAASTMDFSFDYRLDSFPGGTMMFDVLLNNFLIVHLNVTTASTGYNHFDTLLTNPVLQNLSGAELRVQATAVGSSAWGYVDNFSLVAAPEPGTVAAMAAPGVMLMMRRRRKGAR